MFDYSNVTPETLKEYEAVLAQQAEAFHAWTAKNRSHKDEPVHTSFDLWWLFKGPTGFRNHTDTARFKRELFEHICACPNS